MRWLFSLLVILVLMLPAAVVGTEGSADLRERFSEWIDERVTLEKERHGFHRGAHEEKLAEKRGMNIPDGNYASDELTFDDILQSYQARQAFFEGTQVWH